MAIGTSLFLLAAGAILKFAVEAEVAGIDLEVVGVILMVIGGLGILLSLFMLNRSRTTRVERRYYDDGSPR
ncbi:MAG: DUF6458 family protein [Actinomycetota bacterium]